MTDELIRERSGLSRRVYMLVDERLPKDEHIQSPNEHSQVPNEDKIVWRSLLPMSLDEQVITIETQVSKFTARPDLSRDLSRQRHDWHETYQHLCGERTCHEFLHSNAYQGGKNRKTRGPSLLYLSGSGTLCSDNHCCKRLGLTS